MLVSLVIPVLNEADNLDTLWSRLTETAARIPEISFEAVFVDDGSSDDTAARIRGLAVSGNIRWLLVQLSRNFGHQAAITAGIETFRSPKLP